MATAAGRRRGEEVAAELGVCGVAVAAELGVVAMAGFPQSKVRMKTTHSPRTQTLDFVHLDW